MMPKRTLLSVLLVMTASCMFAQKKNVENALLWKVTGNHLSKPSFLYGTIHLQDKRVFNFSDSLYNAIRSTDGYAMEVHPDSIVNAIMQKVTEEATNEYVKKYMKKEEFDELNSKFRKEFGFSADKLTVRETYLLRQRLAKPERKADDMPTIVDAYLYGVAKNQGKEIQGLERAIDQVNMMNDIEVGDIDVKKILKNLKKEQSLIEKFIQLYLKEDLQAIGDMMSYLPDKAEDKLLNLRNHLMVQRMDSLIRSKSFVVAVGSAHLPGEQGMIELLRQKGYTVEPVFTTTRTHANAYAIKAQEQMIWVDVKEPSLGYSARMPGKPSPLEMLNGVMKMNMYMDLTSMKQYYTAFVLPAVTVGSHNADSVLQGLYRNMVKSSKGEGVSEKRFTRGDFEAIDMLYKIPSDNLHARVQSFAHGKRVYLVGMGARNKEDLYGKEATAYFNAFIIEKMPELIWQRQTFDEHYFSVLMPGSPKKEGVETADTSMNATQFSSVDDKTGSYYGVLIATANPGFVVPDDLEYFESSIERLTSTLDLEELQTRDTVVHGFNAKGITGTLKKRTRFTCLSINRGNRLYSLLTTNSLDDTSNDVMTFYSSFSLLDYPELDWSRKNFADQGFTLPVAGVYSNITFKEGFRKVPDAEREYTWTGYDPVTATTFTIEHRTVNRYLWAKHDSVVLKNFMNNYVTAVGPYRYMNVQYMAGFGAFARRSIREYKFVTNGNVHGIEFIIPKDNSSHTEYVRILLSGKHVYTLYTEVPEKYWNNHGFDMFMSGFRLAKEEKTDYLQSNSFRKLLDDLRSTDSATFVGAYDAIYHVTYDSTDVPRLLAAASMTEFPMDTLEYEPARNKFLNIAGRMDHPNFISLVAKHYKELKPGAEKMKYGLLEQLSKTYTTQSYALIKELLAKGLPTAGRPFGFVHALEDSLELTKTLYPQLLSYTSDSLTGVVLCRLHKMMLDSNMISAQDIRQYEPAILHAATKELERITRSGSQREVILTDMLDLLVHLKTGESTSMLRKLMESKQINVTYHAAMKLMEIGQPIDAATLSFIADNKYYRVFLYEELEKQGKLNLFPAKHLNQKGFAEAYLETFLEDDEATLEFIEEKVITYKGKFQRFYLFRVTLSYSEEKESYLGVSGPFDINTKKMSITKDYITGIYEDETFKKASIDKHFRLYLAMFDEDDTIKIGTIDNEKRD